MIADRKLRVSHSNDEQDTIARIGSIKTAQAETTMAPSHARLEIYPTSLPSGRFSASGRDLSYDVQNAISTAGWLLQSIGFFH